MSASGEALLERLLPARSNATGAASTWLRQNGLPSRRDEAWKYTPLDDILAGEWHRAARRSPPRLPDRETVDTLAGRHADARMVFVDGVFAPALSDVDRMPAGVRCGAEPRPPVALPPPRYDGFQALNDAAAVGDPAVIVVAPGTRPVEPIHVVHVTLGDDVACASHPRTAIDVGPGAHLAIIESYAGTPGRSLTNATTSITLGTAADLVHHRVVSGPADGVHVGHTLIRQAAGSNVRSWSLLVGAEIARNAIDVVLAGDGASVDLEGLYLPVGRQRHDTVVTVEHAASGGVSRQRFRGVVDDHGRGSFSGHVIVASGTAGNDAGQTSRSLLLCPTAQADTRPWLEIFADDVRCTHGAAIGRLDDEALFYLRARGIPRDEARAMLVGGFVAEATDSIEPASLRSFVESVTRTTTGRTL